MKTFNHILLLGSLAFGGAAMAGVPVKAPLSRYQALWQSSLFTT